MPISDQVERELIRTGLDKTLVVEAAAGTGKTTELVNRIISILASGLATVDRIVAVTFTEKAAGELKLRLRAGLDRERASATRDSDRYRNIEGALSRLEEARAGTIHSFCADLLRAHPMEAGIDPEASSMDENEAARLYGNVFNLWLQETLENPPEGVRRSLRRPSEDGPTERLRKAGWELTNWRDFHASWSRPTFDRQGRVDELIVSLGAFVTLTANPSNARHPLYVDTWQARQLMDDVMGRERTRARDYDGLEAELVGLARNRDFCTLRRKGYGTTFGEGVTKQQVLDAHAALVSALQRFSEDADADLAALLSSELRETISRYEQRKEKVARLDFLDLLLRARDLVRGNDDVRKDLQQRFTHIFVDEFQDTDPLQAEVLLLLAADDPDVRDWRQVTPVLGKLFIVGDPKQSIYRFRRADVGVYQQIKDMLVARGATVLYLRTSFRSVPSIQNAVNASFASVMTRDPAALQAEYVSLAPFRPDHPEQPSVVALSIPRPYGGFGRITEAAILDSLPDATGAFIEWVLKDSGWTVTERGGEGRVAIAPRHICVLFRRFEKFGTDMAKPYADALQARGVPHVLVGGKSFHQREEVGSLRTALAAIEWPDDELSVFSTLRGSLFAVPDHLLLIYRNEFRHLHPFRIPAELSEDLAPIRDALQLLADLHRNRNFRPVARTISLLLDATRAHAGFAMRPSGEQVLANVLHVADLARAYEAGGGISFRSFVEQLMEEAERGESPEAAIYEEGMEGVRLMTVHRAKGLEFPVVILADITAKIAARSAGRYIDTENGLCAVRLAGWLPRDVLAHQTEELARDRAEGIRVAYVAATRARDILVIPATGDHPSGRSYSDPGEWWTGPIYSAVYPPLDRRRNGARAAQCPDFRTDSVIRPPDVPGPDDDNVRPGAHQFGSGDSAYSVVWWDPRVLSLGRELQFSLRQEQLLHRGDTEVIESDVARYKAWLDGRDCVLRKGSEPTLKVKTVSEIARGAWTPDGEVEVIPRAEDGPRPSGVRFGTLVHTTLAAIPLHATADQVEAAARLQGRILAATDEEVVAAIRAIQSVVVSALWRRAREAASRGACRREVPVTVRHEDGVLIEGVVDLAFLEDDTWVVADFKTDQELGLAVEGYKRQISLYAKAIREATGKDTKQYIVSA